MPYLITTTTFREAANPADRIAARIVGALPDTTTRHAVATLDEARDSVYWDCFHRGPLHRDDAQCEEAHSIPESGGTVGPLPDGTVIEVAPIPWDALARETETPILTMSGGGCAKILDAYNAAQEGS